MDVLPLPRVQRNGGGRLRLAGAGLQVEGASTPRLICAVDRFRGQLAACTGASVLGELPLHINCMPSSETPALGDNEQYRLEIDPTWVRIDAPAEWGVLRALATLIQLVGSDDEGFYLPHVVIEDVPRFAWRGLMVDVARHFITIETLERTLDVMAFYKLNVMHLHLSDDQGFRFRGLAFPELADRVAYYTAGELEALVRHAAARGIRLVPELDVPGHVTSWLAVHPQWGLGEAVTEVSTRFGVHNSCLDPANEDAVRAVAVLFAELAQVFPDAYAHFGGDEVHLDCEDVSAMQAAFNVRIVDLLGELNKTPMAWDEVIHPDLPRKVVVQSWRGPAARERALAAGFDTVYSAPYYIDLFYPADLHYLHDPETGEGPDLAADARLGHVREGLEALAITWRDPRDAEEPSRGDDRGRVLGGEACMWAELVTDELFDLRVWSRMPAIAERLWSSASVRDVDDMYRRLSRSHAVLARTSLVDLDAITRRQLSRLGLSREEIQGLIPLIEMLEPIKWYARLLGQNVMHARVHGARERVAERPYDTSTPLNRIVDIIPPESLATRRFAGETDELALRETSFRWRRQRDWVSDCRDRHPAIAELDEVSAVLFELSEQLDLYLDGGDASVAEAAVQPQGEYLLPVARLLVERFE